MKTTHQFTALIEREGDGYVALCPELDIASQADTVDGARANLLEAVELFFESADPAEIANRQRSSHIMVQTISIGGTVTVPVPDHKDL